MRFSVVLLMCSSWLVAQSPDQISINAPFVTSNTAAVEAMLKLGNVKSGDVIYDLGCGDGRIVIAAAKKLGIHGVGIDINPERIAEARALAEKEGVTSLVRFEVGDLFERDLREATVVAIYLLPDLNLRLRPKLIKELKPGARVVSNTFGMGDWKPDREVVVDNDHLYLWIIR